MTREVAIEKLELMRQKVDEETYRALVLAIKALEQEPCDDGNNLCSSCTNIGCEFQSGIVRTKCAFYMPPHIETDNCGNYVVMQPSVTQKSGKWIHEQFPNFKVAWFCNKCGGGTYHKTNYCPNCGAKMESEEQTE